MSGEYFSGGTMPHEAVRFVPDELMEDVEKNIVYACTDVTLRDKATGKIFLGMRQTEPQLGPWFIGGRDRYATGIQENAAIQTKGDLHMELPKTRFEHISTYSTDFPVAAPGKEGHGRHTKNAVMCVDLNPSEVEELNHNIETGNIRNEYSTGAWYDTSEIVKPDSDFPDAVKQFVRDLNDHDLLEETRQEMANRMNQEFDSGTGIVRQLAEKEKQSHEKRIVELQKEYGVTQEEAEVIDLEAGKNSSYAIAWARDASREYAGKDLRALLEKMLPNEQMGDFQVKKMLRAEGITPPHVLSDNSPVLRSILRAAAKAVEINEKHDGRLFAGEESLSHSGPVSYHLEELPEQLRTAQGLEQAKAEEQRVEKEVTFQNYPEKFGLHEENADSRRVIYSITDPEKFLSSNISPNVPEHMKRKVRTLFNLYPEGLKQLFRKTNSGYAELAKHYHTPTEVGGTGDEVFLFTDIPEGTKVTTEQYDLGNSRGKIRYNLKSGDVVVNKPHTYHVFRIYGPVSFVQVTESPDFKPDDLHPLDDAQPSPEDIRMVRGATLT